MGIISTKPNITRKWVAKSTDPHQSSRRVLVCPFSTRARLSTRHKTGSQTLLMLMSRLQHQQRTLTPHNSLTFREQGSAHREVCLAFMFTCSWPAATAFLEAGVRALTSTALLCCERLLRDTQSIQSEDVSSPASNI